MLMAHSLQYQTEVNGSIDGMCRLRRFAALYLVSENKNYVRSFTPSPRTSEVKTPNTQTATATMNAS